MDHGRFRSSTVFARSPFMTVSEFFWFLKGHKRPITTMKPSGTFTSVHKNVLTSGQERRNSGKNQGTKELMYVKYHEDYAYK